MTVKAPTPAQPKLWLMMKVYPDTEPVEYSVDVPSGQIVKVCDGVHVRLSTSPETPCETPQDIKRLEAIIERDRTQVAEGVTAIRDVLEGRDWLTEGRGPYEWNDDNWHKEFAEAAKEIYAAIKPLEKIAGDLSDSPKTQAEVDAARSSGMAAPLCKILRSILVVGGGEFANEAMACYCGSVENADGTDVDETAKCLVCKAWDAIENYEAALTSGMGQEPPKEKL